MHGDENATTTAARLSSSSLSLVLLVVAGCGGAVPSRNSAIAPASSSPSASASSSPTPVDPSSGPAATGLPTSPTVAEIVRLQAELAADPTNADAQRDLGLALTQRVRDTADPSL